MRDIWNPWHGCSKKSEGCAHCYMYYWDQQNGKNSHTIYKLKNQFDYPIQRDRRGYYKVKSGTQLYVCLTSDFFIEEADEWRIKAWEIMHQRPDIIFFLLTKRPERILKVLPKNWGKGWPHVFLNVSIENQVRADERIPILLDLPFKNKGLMVAPFIGPISLKNHKISGQIQQVLACGENYKGARPLHYEWVKTLHQECKTAHINFSFIETGTYFVKAGKWYHYSHRSAGKKAAQQLGLNYHANPLNFGLQVIQQELNL